MAGKLEGHTTSGSCIHHLLGKVSILLPHTVRGLVNQDIVLNMFSCRMSGACPRAAHNTDGQIRWSMMKMHSDAHKEYGVGGCQRFSV